MTNVRDRLDDAAWRQEEIFGDESTYTLGEQGWIGLGLSLRADLQTEELQLTTDAKVPELPNWPSTLNYIETHLGGFHGVTSLAAEKGTGKTMLALASAIEAAASGDWQVFYFAAEDDYGGMLTRYQTYLEAWGGARDAEGRLSVLSVGRIHSVWDLFQEITARCVTELNAPVLVVLDSINTIASLSTEPYLLALHNLGLWAMLSRRMSRGAASFLLVAETNKTGGIKGGNLDHWSDVVLRIRKVKNENRQVTMRLDKARLAGGEGPMGKYVRVHHQGRFLREDEAVEDLRRRASASGMHVVEDPADDEIPF